MKSAWAGWGRVGSQAEVDPESRWGAVTGVQKAANDKAWVDSKYIWKQSWQDQVWGGAAVPSCFGTREQFSGRQLFPLMGWGVGGWFRPSCEPWGGQMQLCPPPPAVRPPALGGATPARRAESRQTDLSNCRSGLFPYQGKGIREGTLDLSGWVWIKTWMWGAWESRLENAVGYACLGCRGWWSEQGASSWGCRVFLSL